MKTMAVEHVGHCQHPEYIQVPLCQALYNYHQSSNSHFVIFDNKLRRLLHVNDMWFSKNSLPLPGKTAVVLGASQGLGAEFGRRLYLQGCSVILVARTESKLKKHKDAIEAAGKTQAEIVDNDTTVEGNSIVTGTNLVTISYAVCDVSDYDAVTALFQKLMAVDHIDPDYVFSFVGLAIPKLFVDLTKQDLASGYQTNYVANVNVAHAFVNQVMALNKQTPRKEFKKRVLCMCSSVVSFYPVIGYSNYAPSKAALDALCTVLRTELKPFNFRVATVFPGNFESEGFIQEEKTKPEITKIIEGPSTPISVENCADIILVKLAKGYDTITTDAIGWVLSCFGLGMYPRQWGFLQVIVSFLLLLIIPIYKLILDLDIEAYYQKKSKNKNE